MSFGINAPYCAGSGFDIAASGSPDPDRRRFEL